MNLKINYYDKFQCTADKCPFNCCQEWHIGIDEETLDKWEGLTLNANESEAEKLPELKVCDCLKEQDMGTIIALGKDKNCPFLNGKKLCRLVSELGEEYLAETCTTFPRQINKFDDRIEYSLDACCPVVIDLMNENTGAITFTKEGKPCETKEDVRLQVVRDMMLSIIEEEDYSIPERMMMTFYALLDALKQKKLTVDRINGCKSKAYLDELAYAIRDMAFNEIDSITERNELFLDVVENYRRNKLYVDYLEDISQAAENLEAEYTDENLVAKNEIFEAEFEKYQNLLKNYLVGELFGNCLEADMNLEDLIMSFEWIAMEYIAIKQAVFLKWLLQGEGSLEYETVRDYIMIISRVTGYDHSDIREYLDNSFESAIWEWGYLALILGNGEV